MNYVHIIYVLTVCMYMQAYIHTYFVCKYVHICIYTYVGTYLMYIRAFIHLVAVLTLYVVHRV